MIITRAIGIDLGTTNSAVAMLDLNEQDLVLAKDAQARATVPSCVWCDPKTGSHVVGYRAFARRGIKPEPITSIKRSMGTRMTVELGERHCTPVEVSAFILQELKQRMAAELSKRGTNYDISKAIVTVPAYFGLPQIEATRQAGELAGLEVTELLHEPTAAAIYYSWKHSLGDGNYMVYDLGGGTFDISILQRTGGEFLVLGISGDVFLGGDDFDRRLAEHLRTLLVAEGYELNLDVKDPEDRLRFNQLVTIAERVKKDLSARDEVMVRDQGSVKDKAGTPIIIETLITRAAFEKLIEDLLNRTLVCCEDALEKARQKSGVTIEQIDHILLVGGSTYVPAVLEKVRKAFCEGTRKAKCATPIRDDPETAVALGAALRAAAAGLGVSDDGRQMRLWFRGSGATRRSQANIAGTIEVLAPDLQLEGGTLRLTTADGEQLGEVKLKPGLAFTFPRVSLQAEALNEFGFEVLDSQGRQVAVLQRSIVQAARQREAVGSTLSTAVLSKPILLEGTDGKRLVRQVLLADGTSLPARSAFTFAVADPGGRIRLPIYQESRIIKELTASVGSITVGTPVKVEIECDEKMHIQVRFIVGDKEFGGKIDPPGEDTVSTEYEIDQIDRRFKTAVEKLDPEEADKLREAYQRYRKDLSEALAGADYPKVIQRTADLEGLIRDAHLAEPLEPDLEAVEGQYQSCLDLIPQAVKVAPVPDSLKKDLEATLERAKQAYMRRDRQTYEDATRMIETSLQYLAAVTRAQITDDSNLDSTVRAIMALDRTRQIARFLMVSCLMAGRREYFEAVSRQLAELDKLEEKANKDPVAVLNRCQVLLTENRRIYQEINPEQKIGSDLDGLLNVNTHSLGNVGDQQKPLFGQR